jgi:hypothetical protein
LAFAFGFSQKTLQAFRSGAFSDRESQEATKFSGHLLFLFASLYNPPSTEIIITIQQGLSGRNHG